MNKTEILKRNNFVIEILQNHEGVDNAISTQQLCQKLKEYGKPIRERYLPQIIKNLRDGRDIPIGYKRGLGYFIATSKADIDITIQDLQNQIDSLQNAINFMKKFYLEQYLIEFYDNDYETLYEEYVTVENEDEARKYANSMALQIKTNDYKVSIRNVKDI